MPILIYDFVDRFKYLKTYIIKEYKSYVQAFTTISNKLPFLQVKGPLNLKGKHGLPQ